MHCQGCGTAFLTTDDHLGRSVACPKCGAAQDVPTTVAVEEPGAPGRPGMTAWVPPPAIPPDDEPRPLGPWPRRIAAASLLLIPVLAVAALVAWPTIRDGWRSGPVETPRRSEAAPAPDPTEAVAAAYLQALVDGDTDVAGRVATVDDPPAIRSFGPPRLDQGAGRTVRGSFGPIAALHERIDAKFKYDPEIGRYTVRDPIGPAAETLDALHEAKAKAESENIYARMGSGDPDEALDAIESFLGSIATPLASKALTPQKLVPTYSQLIEDADPPLPDEARALASTFADDRATWDELLKRPFPTLKADGPFILEEAVVLAPVRDTLASAADPPSTLRLTLTRFRLEGIDTGWRITSARRVAAGTGAEPDPEPAGSSESSPAGAGPGS